MDKTVYLHKNMYKDLSDIENLKYNEYYKKKSIDDFNNLIRYRELDFNGFDYKSLKYYSVDLDRQEKVINFFGLKKINEIDNELTKLSMLNKWAYKYFHSDGEPIKDRRYDGLNIFDLFLQSKNENKSLNCRYISMIFTQILSSLNFYSRWIIIKPHDINDCECHCLTEVYVFSLKKWIALDPSFGLIYFDKKGTPLNCLELRMNIIQGKKIEVF